jgi:hypothetical protein
MPAATSKSFDTPDELRTPPKTTVAVVHLDGCAVARFTLETGWRWSESVRPVAGTETCQVRHLGVMVSGNLHVVDADGAGHDVGPGTAYVIEPGHDAWVVGNEPAIMFEFDASAAESFAAGKR